jgi:protein-S-isoprenylcysteine O-methyltransferase Ste14
MMLAAYYALLLLTVFAWPTWWMWKREKINALVLPSDDTAEGVIGLWFKGLVAAVAVLVTTLALGASPDIFGRLSWAESGAAQLVGWILLGSSLVWMAIAQRGMGRSWRIGIDSEQRGPLVRASLFRMSRNPIFLGLRLNLLGLFFVVPNAVTLSVALLGEALMQVQVRLEERHLSRSFGADYADYRRAVRRWL